MYYQFSILLKYYVNIINQIWWVWNGTQPLYDMAFDHVITWQIKNIISHKFYKGYSHQTWLEGYENNIAPWLYVKWFIISHLLYSYMSFVYVIYIIWSRNLVKLQSATSTKTITTNLGGNTYQNEMAAYLHVTWPNNAKVIKATTLKLLQWKVPISTDHVIFDYMISWQMKGACSNFYKSSKAWNLIRKNWIWNRFTFINYVTNAASWSKLKLLPG